MKKLSFVFALVFAGSMAMAQNLSTVGQVGIDNDATVTQITPSTVGNTSAIDQVGNFNVADVDQDNNGFSGAGHNASIQTVGNYNLADIEQINFGGDAVIIQVGNSNQAQILENGNFPTITPEATNPIPDPFDAYAYQEGYSNKIKMELYADIASAYAYQKGNWNEIVQSVGQAVGEKAANSWVTSTQIGNGNYTRQVVEGLGWSGDVDATWQRQVIVQTGNGNYAVQRQYNDINPATDNYAHLEQNGNDNISDQRQAGKSNQSWVSQDGFDYSTTSQIGTSNYVKVEQF